MKKSLIVALLMILCCPSKSQQLTYQKPDYEKIKKEIQDSSSAFYYPKLRSRLAAFDTTLQTDDFRYLYFGYVFQKEYRPYWTSPDEQKLLKFYRSEKIEEKDYDEIIQLATHSINEFAFDLRQMNFLSYVYHLKGDEEMSRKVSYRFMGILGAILSTGDGKTCETAFHVISVSHEYVLLNMFRLQMNQQALTGDCDYLKLVKNENNIDGLYFNVEKLFEKNLQMFNDK